MRLQYSQAAQADLRRIDIWLNSVDADVAVAALWAIRHRVAALLAWPAIGTPLHGGTRKIVERRFGYIIFYRHDLEAITILRIRHARKDWR